MQRADQVIPSSTGNQVAHSFCLIAKSPKNCCCAFNLLSTIAPTIGRISAALARDVSVCDDSLRLDLRLGFQQLDASLIQLYKESQNA